MIAYSCLLTTYKIARQMLSNAHKDIMGLSLEVPKDQSALQPNTVIGLFVL